MLAELNQIACQRALESLRERYPEASEKEWRRHLAERLLGSGIARMVSGYHLLRL
jgi:hypothetical protein